MNRWRVFAFFAVAAALLLWLSAPTAGFNPQPEPPGNYLVSIRPGDDGLRLNLLFDQPFRAAIGAAPTCRGSVKFLNLLTGEEAAPAMSFSLAAGKGTVLTFAPTRGVGDGATVMGIEPSPFRVVVSASPQFCATSSAELFDVASGRTITILR